MKNLTLVNTVLLAVLCLVSALALHRHPDMKTPRPSSSTLDFDEYALVLTERGQQDVGRQLLLIAMRNTPARGEEWDKLERSCDIFIEKTGASQTDAAALREKLLAGLLAALAEVETLEELETLLTTYERIAGAQPRDSAETIQAAKQSAGVAVSGEYLVDMLREGLQGPDNDERSDALVKIALDGQFVHSAAVPELWAELKKHVDKFDDLDKVTALTVYLGSVTDAIELCENQESFNGLWKIRDEVWQERQRYIKQWCESLESDLASCLKEMKSSGSMVLRPDEKHAKLRQQVEVLADFAGSGNDAVPHAVAEIAQAVKAEIDNEIRQLEEDVESQRQADLKGEKIEPAKPDAEQHIAGEYQKLLDRLEAIAADLDSEAYTFWFSQLSEDGSGDAPSGESPSTRILLNAERIRKLQRQRYNLWALRVIYGASEAPLWYEHLGHIETGYLHPSLHACYSITHDARLQSEQNLNNRQNAVVTLLCKEKIPLEAF